MKYRRKDNEVEVFRMNGYKPFADLVKFMSENRGDYPRATIDEIKEFMNDVPDGYYLVKEADGQVNAFDELAFNKRFEPVGIDKIVVDRAVCDALSQAVESWKESALEVKPLI